MVVYVIITAAGVPLSFHETKEGAEKALCHRAWLSIKPYKVRK